MSTITDIQNVLMNGKAGQSVIITVNKSSQDLYANVMDESEKCIGINVKDWFNGWPKPYTELEWIQSDGNAYLALDHVHNSKNIRVLTDIVFSSTPTTNCHLYGAHCVNSSRSYIAGSHVVANWSNSRDNYLYCFKHYSYKAPNTTTWLANTHYVIDSYCNKDGNGIKVNNTLISTAAFSTTANLYSRLLLFCANEGYGNQISPCISPANFVRFYSFKYWENEVQYADLVPVKDSNNVVCMYDKISKKFFYNQGTGNFIAGPVKQ